MSFVPLSFTAGAVTYSGCQVKAGTGVYPQPPVSDHLGRKPSGPGRCDFEQNFDPLLSG